MSEDYAFMCRELIVMIGITASGKSFHINRCYIKNHQHVSEKYIIEGMRKEGISFDEDTKNMIMAITVRSHMIRGLPIVIDEPNLELESLFIWKKLAVEHNYNIKGVIVDTPIKICVERLLSIWKDKLEKNWIENLKLENAKLKELKQVLSMKHQKILDKIVRVTYGGKK
jgi:predicted kinase